MRPDAPSPDQTATTGRTRPLAATTAWLLLVATLLLFVLTLRSSVYYDALTCVRQRDLGPGHLRQDRLSVGTQAGGVVFASEAVATASPFAAGDSEWMVEAAVLADGVYPTLTHLFGGPPTWRFGLDAFGYGEADLGTSPYAGFTLPPVRAVVIPLPLLMLLTAAWPARYFFRRWRNKRKQVTRGFPVEPGRR